MKHSHQLEAKRARRATRRRNANRSLQARSTPRSQGWQSHRRAEPAAQSRRGAIIVVVLALLGMLALVGFTFYTFARQEASNAEYHAAAAKVLDDPGIDPDLLFNWGLQQIIMGGPTELKNSALYGGRHSLVANAYGRDLHGFNGPGINIIPATPNGPNVAVDQNYDGNADGTTTLLQMNDSPSAQYTGANAPGAEYLANNYPEPDVDYTYPDINNMFLAYRGYGLDHFGNPVFVVIPSYHRPQYFRNATGDSIRDPFEANNTRTTVLRPHRFHKHVNSGNQVVANRNRFIHESEINPATGATPGNVAEVFDFRVVDQGVWNMRMWATGVDYEVGDWVFPTTPNGFYYRCEEAGRSNPNEPGWHMNPNGVLIPDGGQVQWRAHAQPRYEYDADPDGDGIKEAVYLDLDFPVQELGDGRKFMPIFAVTVYSADSRVNLGTAGNMTGEMNLATPAQRFGDSPVGGRVEYISQSNQGLTPAEINPGPVFNADPRTVANGGDRKNAETIAEAFQQHQAYYNKNLSAGTPWQELSNMELWWLATGRMDFPNPGSPVFTDVFPGKWGELALLRSGWQGTKQQQNFPFPGVASSDDDGNRLTGEAQSALRPFVHPLDFRGNGNGYTGRFPNRVGLNANDLNRWLRYSNYSAIDFDPGPLTLNTIGWILGLDGRPGRAGVDDDSNGTIDDFSEVGFAGSDDNTFTGQLLMQNGESNALLDDSGEYDSDPLFPKNGDEAFGPEENAFLAMSNSDVESAGISSRVGTLAPWNLKQNIRSREIRDRLTTTSFDLNIFSIIHHRANSRRGWEWENLDNTDPNTDRYLFPRRFTGVANDDPLRPPLRALLRNVVQGHPGRTNPGTPLKPNKQLQQKLSPNHVLDTDATGNLISRNLREHPINLAATPVVVNSAEWLARRDRQQLARDIYVLLYYFCGGRDGVNTFTTANTVTGTPANQPVQRVIYNDDQLEAMARFAVNLVDSMDRDHTLTRFEYDKDLSDGWNLDDDAYTDAALSDPAVATNQRGEVFGVEEQLLTLSEVLAIQADKVDDGTGTNTGTQHDATEYNDTEDRWFSYIELRNASPFSVKLDNGAWRLRVEFVADANNPVTPADAAARNRMLTPLFGQVEAGTLFTIQTAGDDHNKDAGGQPLPSHLNVDPAFVNGQAPNAFTRIAPRNGIALADRLDLISDANTRFRLELEDGTSLNNPADRGKFLRGGSLAAGGNITNPAQRIDIILERRTHLHRNRPPAGTPGSAAEQDNPFVEVDRMRIPAVRIFNLDQNTDSQSMPSITEKLQLLQSTFRRQPLDRANVVTTPPALQSNSLGGNDVLQTPFSRWMAHYNRPFTSVVDLFSVPLYGPEDVTRDTEWRGVLTAGQQRFLRPDTPNNAMLTQAENEKLDNRWYRLLEFLHPQFFSTPLYPRDANFRTAGKLDWNNMQHPEVLAGLLDSPVAFNNMVPMDPDAKPANPSYLPDANAEGARDWWMQFLRSRDQVDVVTQMTIPGTINSRPFRSLSHASSGNGSLEDTILRRLPLDSTTITPGEPVRRRLFELRTQNDVNVGTQVDHHSRHRVLSKVMNNTTNRSNVFFVFIQVDFFEVFQEANGAVRIGGKLDDSPGHRGFFVVDRSQAFQHLQDDHFPASTEPALYTLKDTFDFHKLILFRQRLD